MEFDRYDSYQDDQPFAVAFHKGYIHAPDGWPAETAPLAPGQKLTAAQKKRGFVIMTKRELNELRDRMQPEWDAVNEAVEKNELEIARQDELAKHDELAAMIERVQSGEARKAIEAAASYDELRRAKLKM